MKKIIAPLILPLLSAFVFTTASAQSSLDKKTMISQLDNTNGMTMDNKQKKDYDNINSRTADELIDVDKSNKPKNDRDKAIDGIFDKRDKDVDNIFGNDKKYDESKRNYDRNSKDLRRKYKLTKFVL